MDEIVANGSSLFNFKSFMIPRPSKIKSLWQWYEPESTPLRIAISGVTGTGKRKLAYDMSELLDICPITNITRTLKELGVSINKKATIEDEFLIFMAYAWEQQEYEEFVSAGSFIDVVAHMNYLANKNPTEKNQLMLSGMENMMHVLSNNAYTVNFYIPFRSTPKADGVRSTDEKYLREIDRLTKYYIDAFDIDVMPLDGTADENLENAIDYMQEFGLLDD